MTAESVEARLQLLDWRRTVSDLYAAVRGERDPERAWHMWRAARERLFLEHPQSPLPIAERNAKHVPRYFEYEPRLRVYADVSPADAAQVAVPTSHDTTSAVVHAGTARFELGGVACALDLHWLTDYAGGLLVMFRDATSGKKTYGAGRYVLDTAKGADLGSEDGRLVLDFNFAYQPSCSYDPAWECPLPPRPNWLTIPVAAGERLQ